MVCFRAALNERIIEERRGWSSFVSTCSAVACCSEFAVHGSTLLCALCDLCDDALGRRRAIRALIRTDMVMKLPRLLVVVQGRSDQRLLWI